MRDEWIMQEFFILVTFIWDIQLRVRILTTNSLHILTIIKINWWLIQQRKATYIYVGDQLTKKPD